MVFERGRNKKRYRKKRDENTNWKMETGEKNLKEGVVIIEIEMRDNNRAWKWGNYMEIKKGRYKDMKHRTWGLRERNNKRNSKKERL